MHCEICVYSMCFRSIGTPYNPEVRRISSLVENNGVSSLVEKTRSTANYGCCYAFDFLFQFNKTWNFTSRQGLMEFILALRQLASVLNGRWWVDHLQHFCTGPSCCSSGKATAVLRAIDALMKAVFMKAPACPAVNKWSKLGPCVDILMFGLLVHQVLPRAFALMRLSGSVLQSFAGDDDGDYLAALDFSALQGKRYNASKVMLQDPTALVAIICLSIILEPLRVVTAWFMRRAHQSSDSCARPPIVDLLSLPHSCIIHARQYLSSLVAGRSTRLILLWRHCSCESLPDFYDRCGDSVRLLRRMAMVANASLYRRYQITKFPWVVLRVIDDRIDLATRVREADAFYRLAECCMLKGFFRKLRSSIASANDLFASIWQDRLRRAAQLMTLQVADIEWRHGRNRKRAQHSGLDSMTQMVARSVAGEAGCVKASYDEQQDLMHQRQLPELPPGDEEHDVPGVPQHRLLRAPTAKELLRTEILASAKARGQSHNPTHASTFRLVDQEFDALSEERRQAFEQRSNLLKSVAKQNREALKQEKNALMIEAVPLLKCCVCNVSVSSTFSDSYVCCKITLRYF